MFRSFGPLEIGLIVLIIIIVFGVGKLPQAGEAFGKAIRGFKKTVRGEDEEKNEMKAKTTTTEPITKS